MVMNELKERRETFVLTRGNYEAKTDQKVIGAVPAVFQRGVAPNRDEAP
jgi:hypothetical protein